MVERTVRGATSADVVEERSRRHVLRCDMHPQKVKVTNGY